MIVVSFRTIAEILLAWPIYNLIEDAILKLTCIVWIVNCLVV